MISREGNHKHVLCVCAAGLLRSATTAFVLTQEPYNHNTRAVGIEDYALIPLTDTLCMWADQIVCMERQQQNRINERLAALGLEEVTPVVCLDIPDDFNYREAKLIELIKERYK